MSSGHFSTSDHLQSKVKLINIQHRCVFFFPPFNPLIKGEHSNCPMDNSYEEVLTKNVGQYFENYQYMT